MCTWDIRRDAYKVIGFELFSSSINYLSLNMSTHVYINLIELLRCLSFMQYTAELCKSAEEFIVSVLFCHLPQYE